MVWFGATFKEVFMLRLLLVVLIGFATANIEATGDCDRFHSFGKVKKRYTNLISKIENSEKDLKKNRSDLGDDEIKAIELQISAMKSQAKRAKKEVDAIEGAMKKNGCAN